MTPTLASKALLWILATFPFANATIQSKMLSLARALPRLALATADATDRYIDDRLGLDPASPYRDALHAAVQTMRTTGDPRENRSRFIIDLELASCQTARVPTKGECEERMLLVARVLTKALP